MKLPKFEALENQIDIDSHYQLSFQTSNNKKMVNEVWEVKVIKIYSQNREFKRFRFEVVEAKRDKTTIGKRMTIELQAMPEAKVYH
jgi:hypothetical protein